MAVVVVVVIVTPLLLATGTVDVGIITLARFENKLEAAVVVIVAVLGMIIESPLDLKLWCLSSAWIICISFSSVSMPISQLDADFKKNTNYL